VDVCPPVVGRDVVLVVAGTEVLVDVDDVPVPGAVPPDLAAGREGVCVAEPLRPGAEEPWAALCARGAAPVFFAGGLNAGKAKVGVSSAGSGWGLEAANAPPIGPR
jgi:hypothetical protein